MGVRAVITIIEIALHVGIVLTFGLVLVAAMDDEEGS